MSAVLTGKETEAAVYFCPTCGSSAIDDASEAILLNPDDGAAAHCRGCGWTGAATQLLVTPFSHDFTDREEILVSLMNDMRAVMSKHLGTPFARVLLKWGFLRQPLSAEQLARYTVRVTHAVMIAILEERQREEKERASARSPTAN